MKKQLILLFTLIFTGIFSAAAQDPIYVVNGQVVSDIRNIPPGDIESTEMLPADEQTIAGGDGIGRGQGDGVAGLDVGFHGEDPCGKTKGGPSGPPAYQASG